MALDFYLVIDFDSTFVKLEGLEELLRLTLQNKAQKNSIQKKVQQITNSGMDGSISFRQSLNKRIRFMQANESHIKKLVAIMKANITPSILENQNFFREHGRDIFIISGGFKEWILPVVKNFGIPESNVLANSFIFNEKGEVVGYEKQTLLSHSHGKVKQLKKLNLKKEVYVVGDGFTDYEIKKAGLASNFFVFTENVKRDAVVKLADYVLPDFNTFLQL